MRKLAASVGSFSLGFLSYLGDLMLFSLDAWKRSLSPPFLFHETVRQIYFVGVQSLPLTTIAAAAVGIVLAMQSIGVLEKFGAVNYVSIIVGHGMVRELGPVVTALMVAGRAGSGISAELGSMRVTRQIDAMQVTAVNPVKLLVVSRVMACIIVVPLLTVVADVVGMLGGLLIGHVQAGIPPSYYISVTVKFIGLSHIIPGLLKTFVFGFIIGIVACYQGFRTSGGTEGVGLSTTATVVNASLIILLSDVILTRLLLLVFE